MRHVMSARMTTGNSSPLALCTVISRTPSLPSSRIGASAASADRRVAQLVDEAAERDAAAGLMLARQLGDVQHVGERLLAGRPQDESDVRARLGEQPADRVGDRTVVARAMQLLQQAQRVGNRQQVRVGSPLSASSSPELPPSSFGIRNGWKAPKRCAELEQMLVVDREERALQRREHRQLVVRPLDGGQRRADRLDLFASVKRLAADEQMRNAARLDRVDVWRA